MPMIDRSLSGQSLTAYQMGPWRVDPSLNRIYRDGLTKPVPPILMRVLCRLAQEPRKMVTRQNLLEDVWSRDCVNDQVLSRAIADLRSLLGDDARNPTIIETVPAMGYRLLLVPESQPGESSPRETVPQETNALAALQARWRREKAAALEHEFRAREIELELMKLGMPGDSGSG